MSRPKAEHDSIEVTGFFGVERVERFAVQGGNNLMRKATSLVNSDQFDNYLGAMEIDRTIRIRGL